MNILAIDSSFSYLSVCVQSHKKMLSNIKEEIPYDTDKRIIPVIHHSLENASLAIHDISLIVCGMGPGSFTGTRIALVVAKGFTAAQNIPIVGLSLCDAWAYEERTTHKICLTLIPGPAQRFFARLYQHGDPMCDFWEESLQEIKEKTNKYAFQKNYLLLGVDLINYASAFSNSHAILSEKTLAASLIPKGIKLFQQGSLLPDDASPIYIKHTSTYRKSCDKSKKF